MLWKQHPENPELQWDKKTGKTRPAETVRVYTFGLPLGPTVNGHLVDKQMRLAAKYRNRCTEIILQGRKDYRALVGAVPKISELEGRIKVLREEKRAIDVASKKANSAARKRGADPEAKSKKAKLDVAIKKLVEEKKAAKESLSDPATLEAIQEGNTRTDVALKAAYQEASRAGCYWGNLLFVNTIAAKQRMLKGTDPTFKRRDGSGVIAVHVQGKVLTTEKLYAQTDSEVRIDRTPRVRFSRRHPEGAVVPNSCTLRFRVESDGKKPVWATFPMLLDERGLPEGGEIDWIRIHRHQDGTWDVQFVVSVLSASVVKQNQAPEDSAIGIDIGWSIVRDDTVRCEAKRISRNPLEPWRRVKDPEGVGVDRCGHHTGIRVGFCTDSEGKTEPILLPPDIECDLSYANHIRSRRDKLFGGRPKPKKIVDEHGNEVEVEVDLIPDPDQPPTIMQLMREWCAGRKLPAVLEENLKGIEKWRSSARMQKVYEVWREIVVPGDETIFPALRSWANTDRHMYQIESGTRGKALRRRREFYRTWCKSLVEEYHTIVVEDFDLSKVARGKIAGGIRTVAAPSELRDVLKQAVANAGGRFEKVDKNGTSRICSDCGGRIVWTDEDKNYHNPTCDGCGRKWDRDHNASRNILDRRASGPKAQEVPDPLAIE